MRLLLAATLALGAAAPTLAGDTGSAVTRWRGGQWTVWRIDRPATGPRLTEYPEIRLRAGDVVTLDAGGCVQTRSGGRRSAVWLPGAPGPVPLAGVLRQPITIPDSAGPDSRPLRLGFAGGACASPTDRFVFVAVKRSPAADASPCPFRATSTISRARTKDRCSGIRSTSSTATTTCSSCRRPRTG